MVPGEEPSRKGLHRDYTPQQVTFHAFGIVLLIVVLFAADRASFFVSLRPLKAFETVQTLFMKNVCATQDRLLLKPKVFVADRAWLLVIEPLKGLLLDVFPLLLT